MITPADVLFAWEAANGIVPAVGGDPTFSRGADKWTRMRAAGGGPLYQKVVGDQVGFSWVEKDGVLLPRRALDLEFGLTPGNDDSAAFDNSTTAWSKSTAITVETGLASVFGEGWTAARINDPGPNPNINFSIVNTGNYDGGGSTLSMILEEDTASKSSVVLWDQSAGSEVAQADIDWSTGTVTLVAGDEAGLAVEIAPTGPNGGQVARVFVQGTGTSGNQRRIILYPTGQSTTAAGAVIIHHAQVTGRQVVMSPVIYSGSPASRAAERAYVEPIFPPQDFAFYTSAVARSFAESGANREWWDVGDRIAGPGVNVREDSNVAEGYELVSEDDGSNVGVSGLSLAGVGPGSVVELAGAYENATGKVRLIARLNGGAWQDGGVSSPASWNPPTAWARDRQAWNETAALAGLNLGAQGFLRDLKVKAGAMDVDPFSGAAADVADELADVPIGPQIAGHPQ